MITCILLISLFPAAALPGLLQLEVQVPQSTGNIVVSTDKAELTSTWNTPKTTPEATEAWTHTGRKQSSRLLSGIAGALTTDIFVSGVLLLSRETWLAEGGEAFAVRLKLTNTGESDINLGRLTTLCLEGPGGLAFDNCDPAGWALFTQQRLKNGKPGAFVPDTSLKLDSDPFLLVDGGGEKAVLIGFVSQDYHMAGVRLQMDGGGSASLEHLRAECDFNGVSLPPGGERTSQWTYVIAGDDPGELVEEFAERMASYRGIPDPPDNAYSVFCSWYYWGPWFSERDLHGQLEEMAARRVPFDVFLIDDCWTPYWGDWFPNEDWPSGMDDAARRIHEAGYRAGIWTCPTLANENSDIAKRHPEWLLRTDDGNLLEFDMDGINYVLDPTYPGVCDHIEEMYRRIVGSWGYDYLKLDFMRSVFVNPRVRFHDPEATSIEAYRLGPGGAQQGRRAGCLCLGMRRAFRRVAGPCRLAAQRQRCCRVLAQYHPVQAKHPSHLDEQDVACGPGCDDGTPRGKGAQPGGPWTIERGAAQQHRGPNSGP